MFNIYDEFETVIKTMEKHLEEPATLAMAKSSDWGCVTCRLDLDEKITQLTARPCRYRKT